MGTWAVDAFGNDGAVDWTYGLDDVHDLSLVEEAIDTVLAAGEEGPDAPDGADALVAIEVIARLQGNWGERSTYSETVDDWVESTKLVPPPALIAKARAALDRILADNSELRELWEESDSYDDWLASVKELEGRVHG